MIAHDTVNNTTTKKVQQHCTSYRIRIVRGRLSCVFFFFFFHFLYRAVIPADETTSANPHTEGHPRSNVVAK